MRRTGPIAILAIVLLAAACGGTETDEDTSAPQDMAAGAVAADFERRFGDGTWTTDFGAARAGADEFRSGGPGKDGIPAIDEPQFVAVADVDFLDPREPVLAFAWNGDARAYPVQILMWHEIVNDVVGGEPVMVTYCPLCNSSVVFKRTVAGVVHDFGVSGLLRNSDLVMFDRQTESWWQQVTGEALVGARAGTELEALPSSTISFADFQAAFPEGRVLSRETGFSRDYGRNPYVGYDSNNRPFLFSGEVDGQLDAVDRVVAVEIGGESVGYAFSRLEDHPVVNDVVGGSPVAVFFRKGTLSPLDRSAIDESADIGAAAAFSRVVDGRELSFISEAGEIRDVETKSDWDLAGRAIAGELAGAQLEAIVHGNHFWFAWAAFKPDTRVWAP
ncbi:MAG: DUF3179 domain-containing protein [Dehalococcoidia bacterium]